MKNKIRKEILALRKAMPVCVLKEKSRVITDKVIANSEYQKAELVLVYIDAKGEVKTKDIIEHSWTNGKKVAVPKVYGDMMKFYIISSYNELELGSFGIMEPRESCAEVTDIPDNSVVIMPGVAFDKKRNRIGYGKGYYDKYFSQYPDVYKIAVAFSIQIIDEIPADDLDIKADCIVTDSKADEE